jgi:low affinity Fe/Cu permease
MQWLVSVIGTKLGLIGAIVLAVAAIILSRGAGFSGAMKQFAMAIAQDMLQVSAALISASNDFLIQEGIADREEFEDFQGRHSEAQKELDELIATMDNKVDLDPLLFTRPRNTIYLDSNPDAFFQRTIQVPENTFYVTTDQIPNFVDKLLRKDRTLPNDLVNQNVFT